MTIGLEAGRIADAIMQAIADNLISADDVIESSDLWDVINEEGRYRKLTLHVWDKEGNFKTNIDINGPLKEGTT